MAKKAAKKRTADKRRRQKAEKRRVKKAAVRHRVPGAKPGESLPGLDDWPEDDHLFWVCHGVNYLASDYEEAIWRPLFPELYEGRVYTEKTIVQTVTAHCSGAELSDDTGYSDGKAIVAWTVQDKATHYSFQQQSLQGAKKSHPDDDAEQLIQQPHQSDVWRVFSKMKTLLKQRT